MPVGVFDIGLQQGDDCGAQDRGAGSYLAVDLVTSGSRRNPSTSSRRRDVDYRECDSLDIKSTVSRVRRGVPVLMATSDRGLVDVERYDAEPGRPIFHGLLGDIDAKTSCVD